MNDYQYVVGYLGELHNYVNELESRLGNLEVHLGELEYHFTQMEDHVYGETEDEIEEYTNEQDSDLFDCPVCGNQPSVVVKVLGMYATYDCVECMKKNNESFVVLNSDRVKEEWNDYVIMKVIEAVRKEEYIRIKDLLEEEEY